MIKIKQHPFFARSIEKKISNIIIDDMLRRKGKLNIIIELLVIS